MKQLNYSLVQTRIPLKTHKWLVKRAAGKGMSIATFLRCMLIEQMEEEKRLAEGMAELQDMEP